MREIVYDLMGWLGNQAVHTGSGKVGRRGITEIQSRILQKQQQRSDFDVQDCIMTCSNCTQDLGFAALLCLRYLRERKGFST